MLGFLCGRGHLYWNIMRDSVCVTLKSERQIYSYTMFLRRLSSVEILTSVLSLSCITHTVSFTNSLFCQCVMSVCPRHLFGLQRSVKESQDRGQTESVHVINLGQIRDHEVHLAGRLG